jgi:hypothetical protein
MEERGFSPETPVEDVQQDLEAIALYQPHQNHAPAVL